MAEPGQDAEDDVQYDLAGNPLPRRASPPPPAPSYAPPPGYQSPGYAPPGYAPPAQAGPVGAAPPAWSPPPGAAPGFTPPPGYQPPGYAPAAPQAAPAGPVLYVILGVVALTVLGLIFGLRAVKPVAAAVPTAFTPYTALDGAFTCDKPGGWMMTKEAGLVGGSASSVSFKSGKALFHVDSDAVGSLMADITNNPAQTKPAVQRLHEKDAAQFQSTLPGYHEQEAQPFQSKAGDARVSEWTAGEGDIHLHGYRATLLGREREISVFCSAPERDWAALKPAFQRLITGVAPGTG